MIRAARIGERSVTVEFSDGATSVFSALWLRDHARDSGHFDSATHQRLTYTAGLDPILDISRVDVMSGGDALEVEWDDAASATFAVSFLRGFATPTLQMKPFDVSPNASWDASTVSTHRIAFDSLGQSGDELPDAIARHGFAVIHDCPLETESVRAVAAQFGYVRRSIFGDVWTFGADGAMADSAYSSDPLRPHTDGTYSHDAPGLQLLLCLDYDATGGESVLVDGRRIFELMPEEHRFFLSRIDVPGEYVGDGAHLKAARPAFRCENGELLQVSFNNYDRAPFRLSDEDMAQFYEAIRAFESLANDEAMQWRHVLAPGEMVIFDNWRLLHGRTAFSGQRQMAGCYVNREDFESRLRQR